MTLRDLIAAGIGIVSALAAAVLYLHTNFLTVQASDQQWQAHIQSAQCAKVSDYRVKIERLKWDLDNLELSATERASKERDLELYLREIEKLDPNGMC